MFVIVEIAGKQFKVSKGDVLEVPRLKDHEEGAKIKLETVLLTFNGGKTALGMPYVSGSAVELLVKEHYKGEKIRVYKKKPKKRYERTYGHRQPFTKVEVVSVK